MAQTPLEHGLVQLNEILQEKDAEDSTTKEEAQHMEVVRARFGLVGVSGPASVTPDAVTTEAMQAELKAAGVAGVPAAAIRKDEAPLLSIPEDTWPRSRPLRVTVVRGAWHPGMMDAYTDRVVKALLDFPRPKDVPAIMVSVERSVGVGEIPLTVDRLVQADKHNTPLTSPLYDAKTGNHIYPQLLLAPNAYICLGVLIKGDTYHMEVTATAASTALQYLQLRAHTPVVNGIIPALTAQDAHDRTVGDKCAAEYLARTAIYMALVK